MGQQIATGKLIWCEVERSEAVAALRCSLADPRQASRLVSRGPKGSTAPFAPNRGGRSRVQVRRWMHWRKRVRTSGWEAVTLKQPHHA